MALARFWEKLLSNPSQHSREQAYDFLAKAAFQITEDGDVVAFKRVYPTTDASVFESGWASQKRGVPSAYVNGIPIKELSKVPQRIGDTVTMPRSEVVHDPSNACARGLHVATQAYLGNSGTIMEVHVNPRDIVSVPRSDTGKARVCAYKVAGFVNENPAHYGSTVLRQSSSTAVLAGDVGTRV